MSCMTTAREGAWRPADTLANRFRLVRAELGITQRELSEKTGIPASQIQSIEDGRTARALDVKVAQIALALGVDRAWLMWGGDLVPSPDSPGGSQCPRGDSNTRPTRYKVARSGWSIATPSYVASAA